MTDQKKLKIEEVARQCGLTRRTIRYYEDIGMLPAPERSEGGTRCYSQYHVERLKKITLIKEALGYSLQDTQKFIALSESLETYKLDCRNALDQKERKEKLSEIIRVIEEQLKLIELKIQKLVNTQTELMSLKERASEALKKTNEEL